MTEEDIDNLNYLELDTLVAKVFYGIALFRKQNNTNNILIKATEAKEAGMKKLHTSTVGWCNLPRFSTDLRDCYKVVTLYSYIKDIQTVTRNGISYAAVGNRTSKSKSLPQAIIKAILKDKLDVYSV